MIESKGSPFGHRLGRPGTGGIDRSDFQMKELSREIAVIEIEAGTTWSL